jgi:hypothetical protein
MRGHHQAGFLFSLLLILLTASNVLSQVNEETTRINEETAQISEETTRGLTTIDELLIQNETQQAWEILEKTPEGDLTPDDRLWQMARVQYEMGRGAKKKEALAIFQKA